LLPIWKRSNYKAANDLPSLPNSEKKYDETNTDHGNTYVSIMAKSLSLSIGGLMLSNALNIVAVRMQNVDYPNNRNFRKALKDLVIIDKHRMFYKGLFPITIACTNLYHIPDLIKWIKIKSGYDLSQYALPLLFLAGTLFVHPFMLVGMRVQCGHFAKTE
jgi:hypothetical protein